MSQAIFVQLEARESRRPGLAQLHVVETLAEFCGRLEQMGAHFGKLGWMRDVADIADADVLEYLAAIRLRFGELHDHMSALSRSAGNSFHLAFPRPLGRTVGRIPQH